jgi:hypothetical protein
MRLEKPIGTWLLAWPCESRAPPAAVRSWPAAAGSSALQALCQAAEAASASRPSR